MRHFLAGLAIVGALAATSQCADDPAFQTFTQRVNDYVRLRKTASDAFPPLAKGAKPTDIANHESSLVAAIRKARPNAKQGDVFVPAIRAKFASVLKMNLGGPANEESRATTQQGNPKNDDMAGDAKPIVQVNAVYPKSAPLSSVPPGLLLQLPQLPPDIEYHFVGTTLVLLDSQSNLIIDYLKEAAPRL